MSEDLFSEIQKAIVDLDEEKVSRLTEEVIARAIDPMEAIEKAFTPGIQRVGQLFEAGDYFLPELIIAGKMVKEAAGKIEKLIPPEQILRKGKIVLGTVQGDIHDIGKNLVATMLSTRGLEVIDIGVDCPADKFIDRALEEKTDLIGASCLLTMTVPQQAKLIECLKVRGLRDRFRVLLGGAATDRAWAGRIGADGFGQDLREAAEVALALLEKKKEA